MNDSGVQFMGYTMEQIRVLEHKAAFFDLLEETPTYKLLIAQMELEAASAGVSKAATRHGAAQDKVNNLERGPSEELGK